MDSDSIFLIIRIVVLLLLVVLSGFFSSAETAFTTVNKIRIQSLAEEGNRGAALIDKILDKRSKMLGAILIGNNIVNIAASSLATILAIELGAKVSLDEGMVVGIMTAVLTIVIIIFGEIIPKNMAMVYSEKFAFAYRGLINLLMIILTPVVFIVDSISKG